MGVKIKVKTLVDNIPQMAESLDNLSGKVVNVGSMGEHAW